MAQLMTGNLLGRVICIVYDASSGHIRSWRAPWCCQPDSRSI